MNLPDTDFPIPAITDKDAADLSAVVELADLVECRSCAILPTSHACSAS